MSVSELLGFLASALILLAFGMKTMLPLRLVALGSHLAFIGYGAVAEQYLIVALHAVLLPINLYRTVGVMRLLRRVRAASQGDLSVEWMKPFMERAVLEENEAVFRKGDRADRVYLLVSGAVDLPEIDVRLEPGALFGEIAMFSPDGTRTASAVCRTRTELLWITHEELVHLCYQQPALSFHLLRLITRRLTENTMAATRSGQSPEAARASLLGS
jgi:hypothetical protein